MNRPFLSIVLPTYNEESALPQTTKLICDYLESKPFSGEIFIVNDGSTDSTEHCIRRIQGQYPCVSSIHYDRNRGKGFAVKQGMLQTRGEIRLFMDVDESTSIQEFDKMEPYLKAEADLAIGTRRKEHSYIIEKQPLWRRLGGKCFNWWVRTLHDLDVRDTQVGFKAFRSSVAEKIFCRLQTYGWAFDVEILARALRNGYELKCIPIIWKDKRESNIKFSDIFKTCLDVYKIRQRLRND